MPERHPSPGHAVRINKASSPKLGRKNQFDHLAPPLLPPPIVRHPHGQAGTSQPPRLTQHEVDELANLVRTPRDAADRTSPSRYTFDGVVTFEVLPARTQQKYAADEVHTTETEYLVYNAGVITARLPRTYYVLVG